MTTETTERYYAEMEAARAHAEDEYFRARPNLQRNIREETLFRAGFERAFKLLWRGEQRRPIACVSIRGCALPGTCEARGRCRALVPSFSNSPRGEEPSSAPTSTPEAGSERQPDAGTAGESPPFDCPVCGAHDYGLYAVALGGCPHCMRAELERFRAQAKSERSEAEAAFERELRAAMEHLYFEPEPLQVYDSNSYRRVGLKRRHQTVLQAVVHHDGQPDITPTPLLRALVAAFNAMLARRKP